MKSLVDNTIGNELFFVYGLIALVIILIIIIIIIDKKQSKKKPQNLFDTLNMKIIADPNSVKEETTTPVSEKTHDVIEVNQTVQEDDFKDLEPIPEIKEISSQTTLSESIASIDEEIYQEEELEKTQAQIRVEEITKALEEAQVEEQIEKDKYEQFEEEQEKNAIISYNELKASFDKLYSENEKIQYLEDDEIPINIEELYQMRDEQKDPTTKKVTLEEFQKPIEKPATATSQSTFKSSPYISPVYGIQKPPMEATNSMDRDIENANQFLQNLKELKNNLD